MSGLRRDVNALTVQAYEAHADAYAAAMPDTVSPEVRIWLQRTLDELATTVSILEVGSGTGLDAAYVETLGYHVERTDAARSFVERLQSDGFDARTLNIVSDPLGGPYSVIIANHVLLHLSALDLPAVLAKMYDALMPGGRLAVGLKYGEGEAWSETKLGAPRYFHLWTVSAFEEVLIAAGFHDMRSSRATLSDDVERLYVVAYR